MNLLYHSLNDTLAASFIGYQTQEVPVNGHTNVEIALQAQVMAGEEMVVTAFGIQREQKSLACTTQGVDTEQLAEARESFFYRK